MMLKILLAIIGAYIAGMIIAWEIYDFEGPNTSNVSAGIIIFAFQLLGRTLGTVFWPFVLFFKIVDLLYDYFK